MQLTLLLCLLALSLPIFTGFGMARARPDTSAPVAALLASVPLLLAFLALAWSLQAGGEKAAYGLAAVLVFGTMALLCGFGLGMLGHTFGTRRSK